MTTVILGLMLLSAAPPPLVKPSLGAQVFSDRCAACHGATGKGDTYVGRKYGIHDFAARGRASHWSISRIRKLVEAGIPAKMPAWKGKLTAKEIDAVSAYVRTFSRKKKAR